MARLNVETKLWADPRFQMLMIEVGDRQKAKGMVVELWTVAQAHYIPNRNLIPESEFTALGLEPLIKVGLAERRESGVYAKGSEEHFGWLFERQEAGRRGGIASAASKAKQSSSKIKQSLSKPKQSSSKTKQNVPSSSSSFSFSKNKEEKTKESFHDSQATGLIQSPISTPPEKPRVSRFSEATRAKMGQFMATYARAYRARYGSDPEHLRADKALIGKIGYWLESVSIEKANNLVEVFLQIEHRPFVENYHNLWEFFRHLNRISHALSTGENPGAVNWGKVFGGAA